MIFGPNSQLSDEGWASVLSIENTGETVRFITHEFNPRWKFSSNKHYTHAVNHHVFVKKW